MSAPVTVLEADWRAIADELARALQETMLRNPTLTARDWNRAEAALGRYEHAGGKVPSGPANAPGVPED
jgi:hypothetical protein